MGKRVSDSEIKKTDEREFQNFCKMTEKIKFLRHVQ